MEEAAREKAISAEKRVAGLRLVVVAIGTLTYPFLLDHAGTHPDLAYTTLFVAWLYGLVIVGFRPFRRFPVLLSSGYTTATDFLLIVAWIYSTGSYESPFWPIMFLSLAAIAYRFGFRVTMTAAALYCASYVVLVVITDGSSVDAGVLVVRVGYLLVGAAVGGLTSLEALEQTRSKIEMRGLAETERGLRAEADQALSLLAAALDSTADGILVVDAQGKITRYNHQFADLWGIPADVLAAGDDDRAIAFVLDQLKDPAGFVQKVRELYASPDAESFDVLDFKDGRVFERSSRPQRLEGKSVGRVWSFRDVTRQRRTEAERLAAAGTAREAERLRQEAEFKSRFINTAAHELNTPLTPVKLQIHVLRERMGPGASHEQLQSLDVLERNFDRLAELVVDLLDAARYQAGQLRIKPHPVDLAAEARMTAESFQASADAAGVHLETTVSPVGMIQADSRRLSQVLFNLVSNALKFTPRGGRVHLRVESAGDEARFVVEDTGIGIDPSKAGKLFQPFSQVHDGEMSSLPGTGLGLYISRAIVEAHGGRIWCESEGDGKGSRFVVALPRPILSNAK